MKTNIYTLKALIPHQKQHLAIVVITAFFLFSYFLTGHIYLGTPRYLELFPWERELSLLPWTIWIYTALYPFLLYMALNIKENINFNRLAYAFILLTIISCTVFFVFPTIYPREFFPIPFENDLTHKVFKLLRMIDKPVNCLPSLHIGTAFLTTFAMLHESKIKGILGLIYSVAMSYSTLTTKQHYIVDIIAALILVSILYLTFWRLICVTNEKS